ncbi:MAG TPA: hypothetical protein VL576_01625 [Candidatus Paceibacterota bacterium]|jgi:hypothetical protein|nr:hypothetical protein [Candidatus Paceibacterota bacterium]
MNAEDMFNRFRLSSDAKRSISEIEALLKVKSLIEGEIQETRTLLAKEIADNLISRLPKDWRYIFSQLNNLADCVDGAMKWNKAELDFYQALSFEVKLVDLDKLFVSPDEFIERVNRWWGHIAEPDSDISVARLIKSWENEDDVIREDVVKMYFTLTSPLEAILS